MRNTLREHLRASSDIGESPRYWSCDSKPTSNFEVVLELRKSPSNLESSNKPLDHFVTSPLHHLRLISASPSSYTPVSNTLEPLRTPLRTSNSASSFESCFELRISPSDPALSPSRRTPLTKITYRKNLDHGYFGSPAFVPIVH